MKRENCLGVEMDKSYIYRKLNPAVKTSYVKIITGMGAQYSLHVCV